MSINIEEIMSEIKADIKEKGYTADMLSFDDVTAHSASSYSEFVPSEYNAVVSHLSADYNVPMTMPLKGNPIIVFIKKIIRKLTRITIRPITEHQTQYNANVSRAFTLLGSYIEAQNKKIAELEDEIKKLNSKISVMQENK